MENQKGFALIELMAVIILVGIIATFAALFLTTGFNAYLNTKSTTEGALNAQMALDRISMELRNIYCFARDRFAPSCFTRCHASPFMLRTRLRPNRMSPRR